MMLDDASFILVCSLLLVVGSVSQRQTEIQVNHGDYQSTHNVTEPELQQQHLHQSTRSVAWPRFLNSSKLQTSGWEQWC